MHTNAQTGESEMEGGGANASIDDSDTGMVWGGVCVCVCWGWSGEGGNSGFFFFLIFLLALVGPFANGFTRACHSPAGGASLRRRRDRITLSRHSQPGVGGRTERQRSLASRREAVGSEFFLSLTFLYFLPLHVCVYIYFFL